MTPSIKPEWREAYETARSELHERLLDDGFGDSEVAAIRVAFQAGHASATASSEARIKELTEERDALERAYILALSSYMSREEAEHCIRAAQDDYARRAPLPKGDEG